MLESLTEKDFTILNAICKNISNTHGFHMFYCILPNKQNRLSPSKLHLLFYPSSPEDESLNNLESFTKYLYEKLPSLKTDILLYSSVYLQKNMEEKKAEEQSAIRALFENSVRLDVLSKTDIMTFGSGIEDFKNLSISKRFNRGNSGEEKKEPDAMDKMDDSTTEAPGPTPFSR